MNLELPDIITILLSSAVNSVLFANFVIPQVQGLKRIKDKMTKFEIQFVENEFTARNKENEDKRSIQVNSIQNLLDIYDIRTRELKELVAIFRLSIELTILFTLIMWGWGTQEWYGFSLSDMAIVTHLITQLCLLIWAIRIYAIKPGKLQDAEYMVKELGLHPHSLLNALELHVNLESQISKDDKVDSRTPLIIFLRLSLRIFGYRFMILVYDEQNKLYYLSTGPITHKSKIWRHFTDKFGIWNKGEFSEIEIGKIKLNLLQKPKDYTFVFLLFLPFFKKELTSPLYMRRILTLPDGNLLSHSNVDRLNSIDYFREIEYGGEGLRINNLRYVGPDNKSVFKHVLNYPRLKSRG
ncbi:MAG: hypothetical protein Q7S57_01065 [bacterium]|nr:hypothetical protein [bacterium]